MTLFRSVIELSKATPTPRGANIQGCLHLSHQTTTLLPTAHGPAPTPLRPHPKNPSPHAPAPSRVHNYQSQPMLPPDAHIPLPFSKNGPFPSSTNPQVRLSNTVNSANTQTSTRSGTSPTRTNLAGSTKASAPLPTALSNASKAPTPFSSPASKISPPTAENKSLTPKWFARSPQRRAIPTARASPLAAIASPFLATSAPLLHHLNFPSSSSTAPSCDPAQSSPHSIYATSTCKPHSTAQNMFK